MIRYRIRCATWARLRSVGLAASQFSQRPLGVEHWRKNSPTAALVASTVSDVCAAPADPAPAPPRPGSPAVGFLAAPPSAASRAARRAAAARASPRVC